MNFLTFFTKRRSPNAVDVSSTQQLVALPSPQHRKTTHQHVTWASDNDEMPIVVDSATSKTLTPHFDDLIDPVPFNTTVDGIGSGKITHRGKIKWPVLTNAGEKAYLEDDEAYFCPNVPYRLLCPHSWRKCQDDRRFQLGKTQGDNANFMLSDDPKGGYELVWNRGHTQVHVPLDPTTNLPTLGGYGSYQQFQTFAAGFRCFPTLIPDDDDVPTPETMKLAEGDNGHLGTSKFNIGTQPEGDDSTRILECEGAQIQTTFELTPNASEPTI